MPIYSFIVHCLISHHMATF